MIELFPFTQKYLHSLNAVVLQNKVALLYSNPGILQTEGSGKPARDPAKTGNRIL